MLGKAFCSYSNLSNCHRRIKACANIPVAFVIVFSSFSIHAQKWDTIYKSQYATWVTPDYNLAKCNTYKTNIDSIEAQLDIAIPLIPQYIGISPTEKPQRVEIDSISDGMGGWAGGGDVGYQISDFYGRPANNDGLRWIRGVIIGEVINATTGGVSSDWPRDWWVDDVWYFPGFMAGEILKVAVDTAFSNYWITSESYPTYPVYNTFKSLLAQYGWAFYQELFSIIKADTMDWSKIGTNPSKIKTDYVIAYLSIAAGKNLSGVFKTDLVANVDSIEVAAIMNVEYRLLVATKAKLNVATAWADFRSGNYAAAATILNNLGIEVRHDAALPEKMSGGVIPNSMTLFSLSGKMLYSGPVRDVSAAVPKTGQSVIACYKLNNKVISIRRMLPMQ
jgi:hypothetical protein